LVICSLTNGVLRVAQTAFAAIADEILISEHGPSQMTISLFLAHVKKNPLMSTKTGVDGGCHEMGISIWISH
jgi:hypothetical protein